MEKNKNIKLMISQHGLKQWQVADAFGMHEGNFSRMLRKPLTDEQTDRLIDAIEKAKKELEMQEENFDIDAEIERLKARIQNLESLKFTNS